MTQYPQPLGQPPYPAPNYPPPWPGSDPTGPAKRAAILMIVLGVLGLLLAGCFGVIAGFLPTLLQNPDFAKGWNEATAEQQLEMPVMVVAIVIAAIMVGVWSMAQIVVGAFVRRGTSVPIVFGIVLTALSLLGAAGNTVATLPTGNVGAIGCQFIGLALLILQLVWLIQAIRNASQVSAMQQMYGWQQQMAMGGMYPSGYGQQPQQYGYGYGYGQMPQQQQMPPQPPQQQQWPPPNGGANQ